MKEEKSQLKELLESFSAERVKRNISTEDIERELILGPGWLKSIESGKVSASLEMFFAILRASKIPLSAICSNLKEENTQEVPRHISAYQAGNDLEIHFKYAKHDAVHKLENASLEHFNDVVKTLRNGLSKLVSAKATQTEAIKSEAVSAAFIKAVGYWPTANPSNIWWFIIYRAYLDPFNHPAKFSRLSFEQSWKRTGGWALEEILVRHYSESLAAKGIKIFIAPNAIRGSLLGQAQANVLHRLEADKADIFLTGEKEGKDIFFGVVHVKASFAERRTDDVPMSKALVDGGYASPLWTMDCKSTPSAHPTNKGELGVVKPASGKDSRSAKRKDIEDDGFFSACFSYNHNTKPTPPHQKTKAKIFKCDFNNPESDAFHQFICDSWDRFK